MAKSTKGAKGLGKALQGKKPKGGSSSTGKGKQQDIEIGGETKPAAGARSSGGSRAVPLDKQISALLNKNGDLKDKSPEAVQKLTQIIGRWEVNETTSLSDFEGMQSAVLKYLKKSGNQEMYVSALAKADGKLPTTALQKDYDTLVGGTQVKPPNESRPKVNGETVKHRPEKRTNRKYEENTGNIDPNPTAVERLEKVSQRMDADAASDDDYLYALGQGIGPNNIDAELARIQTITDTNERQKAILALAQNTTQAMGRGDNATTIKVGQWLDQHLNKTAQPATPKGGGAKVGDGPLPTEKQQSLNFDGGGEAKTEGPEIPLDKEPELKQPNQAANAKGTENVPPETSQGGGGKDTPPPDAKTATGAPGEKPPVDTRDRIEIPPGYTGTTPGEGGSTKGWKPKKAAQKFDNDPMRAEELRLAKEEAAINAKMAKADARKPYKYAAAAGAVGSLAWAWLNSGDDEPEVEASPSVASITGGPSTSTGSSSGSVADGSGGSAGGMSQEQMEYMMKLQQIRDEQKRRHVGFGNTHSGVSR